MRQLTVTDALLGPLLREDAARPRITHYDDGAATRVEPVSYTHLTLPTTPYV